MKLNNRTIIIIIVVAVAAYLVWKKAKDAKAAATAPPAGPTTPEGVESVDGVIAASGMTSADAAYVRQFQTKREASLTDKAQIETKAVSRGLTYAQMLVLDALWTKYYDNATADFKPAYADANVKNYVWKVQAAIQNM